MTLNYTKGKAERASFLITRAPGTKGAIDYINLHAKNYPKELILTLISLA